ncbi:unnamed protein product [Orchesella dallaii]|uniref:Uncharacterized protein n=1 Tax=Orchesella dallaii TaxID=48710 RepID=A0ABP1QK52_9HEXA
MWDPRNGNGQSQCNSVIAAVPQGGTPSQPMTTRQSSALNVFMMGTGRTTINVGVYPPAQRPMTPQNGLSWSPRAMASLPQGPQLQQQGSLGVSETTVPQSGSVMGLRMDRLSPRAAIHPNTLAALERDVGRRVTFDTFPSNGNSPAGSQENMNEGDGWRWLSLQDLMQISYNFLYRIIRGSGLQP